VYFCLIEFGGLAQLGEHLLCKQGVVGSIPSSSTKKLKRKQTMLRFDLLEITAVSFFNNLEEVKFFKRMREHALRVVIWYQQT
jgi:hypothetical protein